MTEPMGRYISFLYRYGMIYFRESFREFGLSEGQVAFLAELYREDGVSQDKLAHIINIDRGTTARALQKLEAEGFIKRVPCATDKRVKLVFLTKKANKIRKKFYSILYNWDETVMSGFTKDETECFINQLKTIKENAVELLEKFEKK